MRQGTPLNKNNTACPLQLQYPLFWFLVCLHKGLSLEKISYFQIEKSFLRSTFCSIFSDKDYDKNQGFTRTSFFPSQIEPLLLRADWSGSICIECCTWGLCWRFYPANIYMLITSIKLESHFPSSTWNNCSDWQMSHEGTVKWASRCSANNSPESTRNFSTWPFASLQPWFCTPLTWFVCCCL